VEITDYPIVDDRYPFDFDCVWVASDCDEHLAVFITTGLGPIPFVYLDVDRKSIYEIEDRLLELPKVAEAKLLVSVQKTAYLIPLAERGFYVYDFDNYQYYKQYADPTRPMTMNGLHNEIVELTAGIRFNTIRFSDTKHLDARDYFSCCERFKK